MLCEEPFFTVILNLFLFNLMLHLFKRDKHSVLPVLRKTHCGYPILHECTLGTFVSLNTPIVGSTCLLCRQHKSKSAFLIMFFLLWTTTCSGGGVRSIFSPAEAFCSTVHHLSRLSMSDVLSSLLYKSLNYMVLSLFLILLMKYDSSNNLVVYTSIQ